MGLDMYLKGSLYVGGWKHAEESEQKLYADLLDKLSAPRCEESPRITAEVSLVYWRKANAIHRWFVLNAQDGEDECQETEITREQIEHLRDTCRAVLKDRDKAKDLLPPQSGFFFGSTEYDDWYWKDLEHTDTELTKLLENPKLKDWSFTYHSSW